MQLPDRNAHPIGTDVPESENAPAGGYADEAHIPRRPVSQNVRDASLHIAVDVHAARAAIDVAEREASVGNGRVIDNRHEPRRIGHERVIEQRLVPVREPDQIDVALEIARLGLEVLQHTLALSIEALHGRGQKSLQSVAAALVGAESSPLVLNGVVEYRLAAQVQRGRAGRNRRTGGDGLTHTVISSCYIERPVDGANGDTDNERTPCAPWMRTPSMSAVADGPVWKAA